MKQIMMYEAFAQVYDLFMDNIPYEQWGEYLVRTLKEYKIADGLVLDLGCGTGAMTRYLAGAGYDMIGVDASQDMLMEAYAQPHEGILYLEQDMREFELYGTVQAIVSVCDCLNYLLEPADLKKVFALAANCLDPGGIFIFDMNTPWKYEELLGCRTFAESREEAGFIWENDYDRNSRINEYALTLYIREEEGLYRRFQELHAQRAYLAEEVCAYLAQACLRLEGGYDAYTKEAPRADSERLSFVARKC